MGLNAIAREHGVRKRATGTHTHTERAEKSAMTMKRIQQKRRHYKLMRQAITQTNWQLVPKTKPNKTTHRGMRKRGNGSDIR